MNYDTIVAELNNDRIELWSTPGYDHLHRDRIRCIPGSRYDAKIKRWHLRRSWASVVQLRGMFGQQLGIGPELNEWATNEINIRIQPSLEYRSATSLEGGESFNSLYPFQQAGVAFLCTARHALLADDMGSGKTIQVAVALSSLQWISEHYDLPSPYPCLIVAPKSVKRTWARELGVWCPNASVVVSEGNKAKRREAILSGADIIVVNYETARDHSRLHHYGSVALADKEKESKELNQIKWSTVVLDEAHRIKDPLTKWTRACWWLGKNTNYRYALTGTPIANHPGDLWSIMHFISPEEYPSRPSYVDRYCLQTWAYNGGLEIVGIQPATRDEFFKILDPRMRRMPKDLVLSQLPPKVREVRWCEMSAKQTKAYKQMQDNMVAGVDPDGVLTATDPMVKRLRLMQFASAYAEFDKAGDLRLSTPSSKIDEMIDWLDDIGTAEPAVVFAQSRQLIMLAAARLEKEGITHRLIVGGMTEDERARSERDFQQGAACVLLGTTGAAGEGITLTRARHVGFLQRSDKMLENLQSEARCHRIGSEVHDSVVITDFVSPGTVEEKQIVDLMVKFERLEEIVRDRQTLMLAAQQGDQLAAQRAQRLEVEEQELRTG